MKRRAIAFYALLLALSVGSCISDTTTGPPAPSPRVEGNPSALIDVIAFFTREFSPDGGIAVMSPDGSGRRPLAGAERGFEPAISPDGRRMAFSRVSEIGVSAIVVMNADGSGATEIVQGLQFNSGPVWSPDGLQIAFRSSHDGPSGPTARISIVNADGSGLHQVSPEPGPNDFAFDEGPTWSPDGTRLAFTRNTVLHIINVDGTGLTALPNEDMAQSASWSPDGQRIAYMSVNPVGDIHVRNADGSNLVALTTSADFDTWPRWSPDGSRLVLSRFADGQAKVITIRLDGTDAANLTPAGIDDFMPDWSRVSRGPSDPGVQITVAPPEATLEPGQTRQFTATVRATGTVLTHPKVEWSSSDPSVATVNETGLVRAVANGTAAIRAQFATSIGSATVTVQEASVLRNVILYATEEFGISELAVVNPDGSGRRRLTTDGRGYFAPDISPDGRQIAFVGFGGIFVMNADATGVRTLFTGSFPYAPAWAPDGTRIAFRGEVPGPFGPATRIFVINADGTGLFQLSPDVPDPNVFYYSDDGPTWSPDGARVIFTRNGELQVINSNGTGLTPIPNEDHSWYPDWSPDGSRVVYGSLNEGMDLAVRNVDGSNRVQLTDNPEQENNPRWSPDGRRLVFCRVVNGFFQLFTINTDGTGETRLTANENAHECSPSWSPMP